MDHDVVDAGPQCTHPLDRHGPDVLLLEVSDGMGGRVRTHVVDGFRCDRGFQVLDPAYPELRRSVELLARRRCAGSRARSGGRTPPRGTC